MMIKKTSVICPNLGLKHDDATSFAYPSVGNYCHNCKVPTVPAEEHQSEYCLSAKHETCPVFLSAKNLPFPDELRSESIQIGIFDTIRGKLVWIIPAIVVIILASYFLSIFIRTNQMEAQLSTMEVVTATAIVENVVIPVTGESTTAAPIPATQTPVPPTLAPSATAQVEQSQLPVVDETAAVESAQGLEFDTPFMVNGQSYLIHMVKNGENYEVLAKKYNTTIDIIMTINYKAISPLWAKSVIVIAPGLTVDDGTIPALETYQVFEQSTDMETLAAENEADTEQMKLFNQCKNNCEFENGDWVLIPHAR